MSKQITQKRYNVLTDFKRVYDFLVENFSHETLNFALNPKGFEYFHQLFRFDYLKSHHMGIWEEEGEIVGISIFYVTLGAAHLHTKKGYEFLMPQLLNWAENELHIIKDDKKYLKVWITDSELEKADFLKTNGYDVASESVVTVFDYKEPFIKKELPIGFTLIDGYQVDFVKLANCIWQGFGYEGVAPEAVVDANKKAALSSSENLSLMRVVVAPNGEYACALGMWYDEVNKYAYLEPMATVPKYRRMGLGTIALMTAMQKTKDLGATYCFGGPVMEFYPNIGFKVIGKHQSWDKTWM